ncbi:MAG: winged helix-turn-helix domain-containing protein [Nitrososphaeraceae archaeon]
MKNRSDIDVLALILYHASENWRYQTHLMNNVSISHSQIIRHLSSAIDSGLISRSVSSGQYKTTQLGLEFLDKHNKLQNYFKKNLLST